MSKLSKNQVYLIILTALLFVLLGVVYVLYILPVSQSVREVESRVEKLQLDIKLAAIEQPEEIVNTTEELGLPEERQVDDLLLAMQQAELISNSRIDSIVFNNYDESITATTLEPVTQPAVPAAEADETTEEDPADGETTETVETPAPVSPIAATPDRPESLKLITYTTKLSSPTFEQALQFVRELEQLDRILRVDTVRFDQPVEEEVIVNELENAFVQLELTITTFYYDETAPSSAEEEVE